MGETSTNSDNADDTTLMAESKEELKSLLMRVKEESERAGLRLNIKKTKIMASSPITSWQTEGQNVEAVTDFLFLGSKITADGDCSYKIRKYLLLYRKDMTNLESVLKSRNITLPTKVHIVKAMVFPVVTYVCESGPQRKQNAKELMPVNCGAGKDSDAGRDWGQEEKGTTEDEMAGWHHQLDGREFE